MKYLMTICTISAALAAAPVYADSRAKAGNIGAGSGAAVGALVGGPVGLIVGAGVGAMFGDLLHEANRLDATEQDLVAARNEIGDLRVELDSTRDALLTLDAAVRDRDIHIAQLESRDSTEDLDLSETLSSGLEVDVLFRTGASTLPDDTYDRITDVAAILKAVPGLQVRLDGYADPRGDEEYNDALSVERTNTVRDALLAGGVDGHRIRTRSHGETRYTSVDGDLDAYALERRVSITFMDTNGTTEVADTGL